MSGDAIRWVALGVVIVATGGGLYHQYQDTRPCVHPIPYAIGTVDARFGIAIPTLISDAKTSAEIWNTTEGKQLFVYDPTAALKVNLIYDEREASAKLGTAIASEQAGIDSARSALEAARAQFAAEQAAYDRAVSAVNARGGASRSEAAALTIQREALSAHADAINVQVASYNARIRASNAEVQLYNQTAGHTFEEGQYVRDATGERINIFEFVGTTQLERVLAHEFGHALGLDHNANPASIMYAENESGNLTPTDDDRAALATLCGS